MPVLARLIEAAGVPTVVVTMMPDVAGRLLSPRVVGVEFPFGHPFGMPGDADMQRHVLTAAVRVLAGSVGPGARLDVDIVWPVPEREAYRSWQPGEPSPIVAMMLEAQRNRSG
ncbi:MAG TPA: hypothetical protein VFH45_08410 [Acidimicrobiales bacterium]|nr:hypothetical protein [Acidimicrobiales bacterium]